jgi:alpha-D-ribose 1-methylphosphonate 5-triphosphate diphosphatase
MLTGHSVTASVFELPTLLDIPLSGYVPSSLLTAAFELVDKADWTPPRAIATLSAEPSRDSPSNRWVGR